MKCKNCLKDFKYNTPDKLCNACYKLKLEGKLEIATEQNESGKISEKASKKILVTTTDLPSVSVASKKISNSNAYKYKTGRICGECKTLIKDDNKTGFCKFCAIKKGALGRKKANIIVEESDMGFFSKKKDVVEKKFVSCVRCGITEGVEAATSPEAVAIFKLRHKCPDQISVPLPPPDFKEEEVVNVAVEKVPAFIEKFPVHQKQEDVPEYEEEEFVVPEKEKDDNNDRVYYLQQKLDVLDELLKECKK